MSLICRSILVGICFFILSLFTYASADLNAANLEDYKVLMDQKLKAKFEHNHFSDISLYKLNFKHLYPNFKADLKLKKSYHTTLKLIWINYSNWTWAAIKKSIDETAAIYLQCGLYFDQVEIIKLTTADAVLRFEKNTRSGALSVEALRKLIPLKQQILIFLTGPFIDNPKSAGFSNAHWRKVGLKRPKLEDTIFLTDYALTKTYQESREKSPYNLMAHELLHVLTNKISHFNSKPHHLLNIWRTRTNLIQLAQCRMVLENKFVMLSHQ